MIRPFLTGMMALTLAACASAPGERDVERGPKDIDGYSLASQIVTRTEPGPPSTVPGECWTHTTLPAVIQTTTQHKETAPGVFSSVTRQEIVQQRRSVWFRTPCPAQMTPEFIASVQRALKARGLYTVPLTGKMDAVTKKAIGRYQSSLGLNSDILSLGATRQLGLSAYSLWDLKNNFD